MKNYYNTLGLNNNCTKEEIKQAFRSLAKKTHPDALTEISDEEKQKMATKFLEINTAYKILSDDEKRSIYDKRYQEYLNHLKVVKEPTKKKEEPNKNKPSNNNKTFTARHKKIDKKLNREQEEFSSNISFQIFRGTIHIFSEVSFRTKNLKLKKKDTISKYLKRNYITLAAIILCCEAILATNDTSNQIKEEPLEKENFYTSIDDYSNIKLNRIHIIQFCETLSQFSCDSGTDEQTISKINDIKNGRIYYKEPIEIPYYVSKDDLNYYTNEVEYTGNSLSDFAKEYETDIETLEKLNEDKIMKVNDSYYSTTTNSLVVPKFITKAELKSSKNNIQKVK